MALKQSISISQRQQLKLSPAMRQSLGVLMMGNLDLCEYAQKELENNPMAEPEFIADGYAFSGDLSEVEAGGRSMQEEILSSIRMSRSECDLAIAQVILANCNDDGYLSTTEEKLAGHLKIDRAELHQCRRLILQTEPRGIAALDLKECLLAQVPGMRQEKQMRRLISSHLEDIAAGRIQKIAGQMRISADEVRQLCRELQEMNPRPGMQFGGRRSAYIRPDIEIYTEDGELKVRPIHYLRIAVHCYDTSGISQEDSRYLKDQCRQAKALQTCIEGREKTVMKIASRMARHQRRYLLGGEKEILLLRDLASELKLTPATVSRAIHDKYYMYQDEIRSLKDLLCREVNEFSRDYLRDAVRAMIAGETQAMSDSEVADSLKKKGIICSRRTIAKYRAEMGIPPAHARHKDSMHE